MNYSITIIVFQIELDLMNLTHKTQRRDILEPRWQNHTTFH